MKSALALERMEKRITPAALPFPRDFSLQGGVLAIEGTELADAVHVVQVDDVIRVSVNDTSASFLAAEVGRIVFTGRGGDDFFRNYSAIASEAHGGAGHDTLIGGRGSNTLFGNAGDDRLIGGPAADRLDGGAGRDTLAGGDGRDVLIGGQGDDRLLGGRGADRLVDRVGRNTMRHNDEFGSRVYALRNAVFTSDFRDSDGDGVDDRQQLAPGMADERARLPLSSITVTTDFRNGADGWTANAVDLPAVSNADYQLDWGPRTLPAEIGTGTGFMLQGMNRSDDLFLYVTRQLGVADGIQPGARYRVAFSITLASNNPSGGIGVGGAAEAVWLKAGGSSIAPEGVIDALGNVRLNVDQGNQSIGGTAATVADSIGNGLPDGGGSVPYVSLVRQVVHAFPVQADSQGRLWLLAGIDSGFEGFTRIYLQRIDVHLTRLPD